jgi:hypothetical protein
VTELEWLASADAPAMAHSLYGRASRRKFLLFVAACYRRLLDPPPAGPVARVAEVLEGYADGATGFPDVARLRAVALPAGGPAAEVFSQGLGSEADFWRGESGQDHAAWQTAAHVARVATARRPGRPSKAAAAAWVRRRAEASGLLRDVFGNPFRPVPFDPSCRSGTAVSLATQMYETRDFSPMPILADALQDAGCEDEELVNHLRGPGPHVRGCWAVDALLGRS